MKKILLPLLTVAFLMLLTTQTALSQIEDNAIEEIINYQGRLIDKDGTPVKNGQYLVVFSLYERNDAIESVWTETKNVTTLDGYFNVYLGKENKFDEAGINFDKTYYLGFTFQGGNEFTPRVKFTIVPYSFTAKKLQFPYIDTIRATAGINLTMQDKGTAIQIHKTKGRALEIYNSGDKSFPVVFISDTGRGGALRVSADGFLSRAAYFTTSNNATRTSTFEIYNHGKGSAMFITNTNEADTMPVIQLSNQSMGYGILLQSWSLYDNKPAVKIDAMGKGGCAEFRIFKTENTESPLILRTYGLGTGAEIYSYNKNNRNSAMLVSTYAKGPAAYFSILDVNNDTTGFTVLTKGGGNATEIIINNKKNEQHALSLLSDGTGAVLYSKATNKANAAFFESNDSTDKPTVEIISTAKTPALYATNTFGDTVAKFVLSNPTTGKIPVVMMDHQGGGRALELHSTSGPLQPALYVKKEGINGVAAIFNGHVTVNGELKKMSGSFVIDHPLDPANKFLSHSFVESPDMKNLYDGIVTLDSKGEATVMLPDWFEALNKDFRYQLTCIGGWAQVYIKEEIKNNQFIIAGGKTGMKVSWMVTGTRHDPWANDHRIKIERDKKAQEKGTYLYQDYYESK
jgi:hypothetical protein